MKIAVTKASKNYINWLNRADTDVVLIDMYLLDVNSALDQLKGCSGLVVTGGEDVQPGFYGKPEAVEQCGEMDPRRDTLEISLIKKAFEMKIPVLGICRGEQIINVALGGTLIPDIPTYFKSMFDLRHSTLEDRTSNIEHQCADYLKCYHSVKVAFHSRLREIVQSDTGFVTSNHHQSIDRIASELKVNAYAMDGIIEGVEWENPTGKSFLMAVQWHPERMDVSNAFSGKIVAEFYNAAVQNYQNNNRK